MTRCTICHTRIETGDPRTECDQCHQEYHRSCWDELGGCGTYGCTRAAQADKPPPPTTAGLGWGDTKPCPACNRQIGSSLLVCSCGARFPWADPMTAADYHEWRAGQAEIKSAKTVLVVLFIGTLIGFLAPLTGPIAGIYAHAKRDMLAGENGTYLALGYGSASLGGVYALIIAVLAAGL